MKHTGLILVFALLAAAASAQELPPWQLLVFPAGSPRAEHEVTQAISRGYVPVGMEIEPGEALSILLIRAPDVVVRRWSIVEYENWNTFEDEVTQSITEGYVPMDISHFDGKLAIMWIDSDAEIDGWRVHAGAWDTQSRARTVNSFQSQGFNLRGISVDGDLMWFLFLRQENLENTAAISVFDKDTEALRSGIVRAEDEQWLPVALAQSEESFIVGFVR